MSGIPELDDAACEMTFRWDRELWMHQPIQTRPNEALTGRLLPQALCSLLLLLLQHCRSNVTL